ncbi:hypothetical protein Q0Z83_014880 [Actinoplanes sichuanensis]|uniref:hypothetical protein n=1 Tax=Actinoplanes sichuanensis TaxID=512349 RepID=UPI002955857D|nr:hypothetical protein [Actinoplanes sichuanensis]BEL03297.1 hypothetical protein Q0Z83_014880 [Actinoplanes sichuanensis]
MNEGKGDRSTRGPTGSSLLETTAHHPFWDATSGAWVDAADLVAGEFTLIGPDGAVRRCNGAAGSVPAELGVPGLQCRRGWRRRRST